MPTGLFQQAAMCHVSYLTSAESAFLQGGSGSSDKAHCWCDRDSCLRATCLQKTLSLVLEDQQRLRVFSTGTSLCRSGFAKFLLVLSSCHLWAKLPRLCFAWFCTLLLGFSASLEWLIAERPGCILSGGDGWTRWLHATSPAPAGC